MLPGLLSSRAHVCDRRRHHLLGVVHAAKVVVESDDGLQQGLPGSLGQKVGTLFRG